MTTKPTKPKPSKQTNRQQKDRNANDERELVEDSGLDLADLLPIMRP